MDDLKKMLERELIENTIEEITEKELVDFLDKLWLTCVPQDLQKVFFKHVTETSGLIALLRLKKAISGEKCDKSFDKEVINSFIRLLELYSQLFAGELPLTKDLKIPVRVVVSDISQGIAVLDNRRKSSFTLPLAKAFLLIAAGICEAVK